MTISVVSQHGPNPQSGKPDRSVSLPVPDPRESAAEMMGGIGNVGNLTLKRLQKRHATLIDRYESLAPDAVNAPYNQEWDELLDEITEVEEQIRKAQEQNPQPPPVEVTDLSDPAARKAALAKWGAPHLGPVPDLPPGTHAMTGTGGHLPGGGGFDFDEFDRAVSEGVAEAEDVPEWLRYASPTTVEQSEPWDLVGESAHTIRDAVGSYVANVAGFDWEDMETVEEMADQIVGDVLGREAGEPLREDSINDRVWTEIIQAAEHAGFDYSLGGFEPSESRAVNLPSGLPGFQSPSASPGSPGFQAPPVRERPGGFRTPAVGAKPGGFQGAPPSVQSMLTHMASGEPPRTGRAHPERPEAPRVPEPAVPLSDEQMERNKQGFEDARKVLNPESTMSSIWDTIMNVVPDVDPKTAIMVASAVAALLAAGTGVGGPLAPVILGGGAALASQ